MFGTKKEQPKQYSVDIRVSISEVGGGYGGRFSTDRTLVTEQPLNLQELGTMLQRIAAAVDGVSDA